MAKFEFPKNPNSDREDPFQGDDGANPFGDEAAPDDEATSTSESTSDAVEHDNVYSSGTAAAQVQPYRPGDYETFLPSRGGLVWWLGFIGCCVQLLSIVVAIIAVLVVGDYLEGIVYGLPGQLIGVAISAPAWIMGAADMKAITAGAMEDDGRSATRWGTMLGVVGTVLGVTQLILYFGMLLFEQLYG